MKREMTHLSQDVFGLLVDEQSLVLVYQTYYEEAMKAQAEKYILTKFLNEQVADMTKEIAISCVAEESEGRIIA